MANYPCLVKVCNGAHNMQRNSLLKCSRSASALSPCGFSASNDSMRRLLAVTPVTTGRTGDKKLSSSIEELQLECQKLRNTFLAKEQHWHSNVSLSKLTDKEKLIHGLHKLACQEYKFTYIDPDTGYKVFTRYRHFLRGKCCGTGCRHCPFEHEAVSDERKAQIKFNSSFYVAEVDTHDIKIGSN